MEQAGRDTRLARIWGAAAADPLAGPVIRMYAARAAQDGEKSLRDVKALTPDYLVTE
jgi:hypothetical protein